MKHALPAVLLLATLQARAADGAAGTVGAVVRNNGLEQDRYVYVRTPSIMHVAKAAAPAPQVRAAIDNYDQAAQLSPDPLIRAESLRRAADLRLQLADAGEATTAELDQAVAGYQRLLADYPDYAENDRALYQLGRAQQLQGQPLQAIDTLRELGRRYPESPHMGDAVFRAAELLYARGRYDEAELSYRQVLSKGSGTPYFTPAQYKYGWALYKQEKYLESAGAFLAILERSLPQPAPNEPAQALAGVAPKLREVSGDALRMSGLAFAALGGGAALNDYCAAAGEPRFAALLYQSLGQQMLERRRYGDAARAYLAFIQRHPGDPLAPQLQVQAVAAYRAGGLDEETVREEARYAEAYVPGAPYWDGKPPGAAAMDTLHQYLGELAAWYHVRARQASAAADARQADFIAAAGWYRRLLEYYPQDAQRAETNLRYADALYDGGQLRDAALQYEQTAYTYAGYAGASEAAYASVQAWQRLGSEAPAQERPAVLRRAVAGELRYAERFPSSAQTTAVLTRAAEDLLALQDREQAIVVSGRVLAADGAAPELRRQALAVQGDARFGRGDYAGAERAYTALLPLLSPADPGTRTAQEQLAAAICKQGEAARQAGDWLAAAHHFERVGRIVPDARIRPDADYDAASAYFTAQDWREAQTALESFRARNPQSPRLGDADKKLAEAYRQGGAPAEAAAAYARIAARPAEAADVRGEAAWLSAALYDQAQQERAAADGYQAFIRDYPQALDRGIEARQRLAILTADPAARRHWLRELVGADGAAGAARTELSKLAAARAQLELGRLDAGGAAQVTLSAPLAASLGRRKQAAETAIAELDAAAAYGYAEVTTAATYEIGAVYRDFGRALLASQPPARLQGEALEQYRLLLEEQADPFEQKAIEAHRANLQRVGDGLWNDWVRQSATQLAELAPSQYGKHEQTGSSYDALR